VARPNAATKHDSKAPEAVPAGSGVRTLDRIIHERLRLGLVSALAVNETLTFGELKTILSATDGNLSVHARKLEEAGYIACDKKFEGRLPRTEFHLTRKGRVALEAYLTHMESLIKATRRH
jgi:DNA-binding transcriptional ArsR family regulator